MTYTGGNPEIAIINAILENQTGLTFLQQINIQLQLHFSQVELKSKIKKIQIIYLSILRGYKHNYRVHA